MSEGYKIAAGNNVALGSLVDIESISVAGQPFPGPRAIPLYDAGDMKDETNWLEYGSGYPGVTWEFGFLFYEQVSYLLSTYCSGSPTSGPVTILTTTGGVSFARFNAVIHVPKQISTTSKIWYTTDKILFSALRPL